MRQLAQEHGQAGWHAHAFPLSVDGIEIVASLVLFADRRAGHRSGWLPWAALAIGTAGSLAANVATAGPATISRLIAGWPALALLIAVKLLSGLLDRDTAHRPALAAGASPSRTPADDTGNGDDAACPLAVPVPSSAASARRSSGRPVAGHHQADSTPPGTATVPPALPGTAASQEIPGPSPAAESGTVPGIAELLPAALAARGRTAPGRPSAHPRCPRHPSAAERPPDPELPPHTAASRAPNRDSHPVPGKAVRQQPQHAAAPQRSRPAAWGSQPACLPSRVPQTASDTGRRLVIEWAAQIQTSRTRARRTGADQPNGCVEQRS